MDAQRARQTLFPDGDGLRADLVELLDQRASGQTGILNRRANPATIPPARA
jgi:hypothetical protein